MSINENQTAKKPDIGGQAVLDGVMMKAPDAIAVAVRKENGDILVKRDPYVSPVKKGSWLSKPFIRGSVNMWLMRWAKGCSTSTSAWGTAASFFSASLPLRSSRSNLMTSSRERPLSGLMAT